MFPAVRIFSRWHCWNAAVACWPKTSKPYAKPSVPYALADRSGSMPSSYSPITSIAFGRCHRTIRIFQPAGARSSRRSHTPSRRESGHRPEGKRNTNRVFGRFWEHAIQDQRDYDAPLDYIHSFTSIRSSMARWLGSPSGRIRASIDSCAWGSIRRNGRPRRLLRNGIWNDGATRKAGYAIQPLTRPTSLSA